MVRLPMTLRHSGMLKDQLIMLVLMATPWPQKGHLHPRWVPMADRPPQCRRRVVLQPIGVNHMLQDH